MKTFTVLNLCFVVSVFSLLVAIAQPFTQSELAWPSSGIGNTNDPFAGSSFLLVLKNTFATNTLVGGNAPITFAVTSGPTHGTVTHLDAAKGTNVYTPANNFVGSDAFFYSVSAPGNFHPANGAVIIGVIDSLGGCATNCYDMCVDPQPDGTTCVRNTLFTPSGPWGPNTLLIEFMFDITQNIDTNQDIILSVYDTAGHINASSNSFFHAAGNPAGTWSPSIYPIVAPSPAETLVPLHPNVQSFNSTNDMLCLAFCNTNYCAGVPSDTNILSFSTNHIDLCGDTMFGATWTAAGNTWTFSIPTGTGAKRFAVHNNFCNIGAYTNIHVSGWITFNVPSGSSGSVQISAHTNACNPTLLYLNANNGAGGFTTNQTTLPYSFDIPLINRTVYNDIEIEPSTGNANCTFSGSFTNTYQK